VIAPHAFEQDDAARLQFAFAHAAEQYLLVERDDQVGFVAAVVDARRTDANAIAARAGPAACGRANLGRDALDRPSALTGTRRYRAELLPATLLVFTRVADHFDDVLLQRGDRFA